MKTPGFIRKINLLTAASGLVLCLQTGTVQAEPVYHPSGPKLTFGGMTHRQKNVSGMGNPAHPASIPYPEGDSGIYGAGLSIGLGLEYDGNDNFYKLLDSLGGSDSPSVPGGDDGSGDTGEDGGVIIPPTLPPLSPEVEAKLDALVEKVAAAAAFLGLAITDTNAKAFASADLPILISNNTLGGAWTFGANISITTNLRGLSDPIIFDVDAAKAQLKAAYQASVNAPKTYDLTGGASVTIHPDGSTKFRFDNNSGVITRAAQISEISIGYSRKVWQKNDNRAYIGIKPKYYNVGLSNAAVPIKEIENAKSIFDALDRSSFSYSQDFALDLGVSWTGKQYQIGVVATNLNQPSFNYPAKDLSGFTNPDIINSMRAKEIYTMERQLKLEGGVISSSGAWGLNFGLDANAVPDPMGDDYQWASIGAGFASDSWWLPGARVGIRKNMAGTKLTYVTGGITVFNIVNVDLATTTETIRISDKTVPRGLIFNIGAQIVF